MPATLGFLIENEKNDIER